MRFQLLVWVVCISCASTLVAQNLVSNPHLDTSVTGWDNGGLEAPTFDPTLDANASPTSGSALLHETASSPTPAASGLMGQCINGIVAGAGYQYGGKVFIPAGQQQTGSIDVYINWFSGPNCTGSITGGDSAGLDPVIGAWQSLSRAVQAPPATQSVAFNAGAFTFNTTPPNFDGNVDDLFLQAAPIVAVPALDGKGLAALTLMLAAAATFFLRRRGLN